MKLPFSLKGLGFGKGARRKDEAEEAEDPEDAESGTPEDEPGAPSGDDQEDAAEGAEDSAGGGRRRLIIVGAGASAAALTVIGVAGWMFLGSDAADSLYAPEPGVPRVELAIPPLAGAPDEGVLTPPREAGTGDRQASAEADGTVAGDGEGADDERPDSGVVVSPVSLVAFSNMPEVPVEPPLARVPDPALVEQGAYGPLPRVGADGRRPWRVYARPFDARDERPRVAVIVTGLGLSQAATEAAITRLPGSVTLAFDPYAKGLDDWIPLAREAGHEVLLSLPMESANFPVHDPGPYALRTSLAPADNLRRLEFVLSRLSGYVGVVTVMGSGFTTAEEQLRPLLEALRGRGLLFVEAVRAPKTLAPEMASEIDLPHVANDMVLDENPSRAAVDIRLAELEGIVRKHTTAVAMAAPNPATLERIAAWAATLEGKNLALAPVSAVALRQRTQ